MLESFHQEVRHDRVGANEPAGLEKDWKQGVQHTVDVVEGVAQKVVVRKGRCDDAVDDDKLLHRDCGVHALARDDAREDDLVLPDNSTKTHANNHLIEKKTQATVRNSKG